MTFEEWYAGYSPAHKSDKERAEDAWKAATQRCLDILADGHDTAQFGKLARNQDGSHYYNHGKLDAVICAISRAMEEIELSNAPSSADAKRSAGMKG